MRTTRLTLATTGLTLALALAACGGQSSTATPQASGTTKASGLSSTAPAGQHNAADVTFASSMIPHHQQAIQMAELASTRATNTQVKDLAAKIRAAQGPEVTTMTGWLTAWGQPTGPSGMGHTMGSMPGMMSDEDMTALMGMSGSTFDRQFLTMMIGHHQGAVQMAQTEETQGANPDAKVLAAKIVADQVTEISQMRHLITQV